MALCVTTRVMSLFEMRRGFIQINFIYKWVNESVTVIVIFWDIAAVATNNCTIHSWEFPYLFCHLLLFIDSNNNINFSFHSQRSSMVKFNQSGHAFQHIELLLCLTEDLRIISSIISQHCCNHVIIKLRRWLKRIDKTHRKCELSTCAIVWEAISGLVIYREIINFVDFEADGYNV